MFLSQDINLLSSLTIGGVTTGGAIGGVTGGTTTGGLGTTGTVQTPPQARMMPLASANAPRSITA